MPHVKRNMPECMRMKAVKEVETDSLLGTIRLPFSRDMHKINEKLPKPNYMKKNSSMPSFALPDL
jgi:hypothetical protein